MRTSVRRPIAPGSIAPRPAERAALRSIKATLFARGATTRRAEGGFFEGPALRFVEAGPVTRRFAKALAARRVERLAGRPAK